MTKTLLSFGHGYSAQALSTLLVPQGWTIYGTTRSADRFDALKAQGITPILWNDDHILSALEKSDHILSSVAPTAEGDPVLKACHTSIANAVPNLRWVGYLSTTGVYGDRNGGWVDENSDLRPETERGHRRVEAERAWQQIPALPLHIFRLAGIYGPGRGPFAKVRNGTAQRIIKPGQVFSRIHVDDIAQVLAASIANPNPTSIYNVCDDDPAPPQDVIGYAAELLGVAPPPEVAFKDAELSPMARSFYAENKRVSNARIKDELGITLKYPDFRSGLANMLAENSD
ncbi:MAG: SDR family oxidoreductase [Rhodobacteraceae bacterium]|jgi:nucleoside-diphosphate-sugar epimerase|nr:SDR family oxidoreductase [Paracoccaceae bacterium]